MTMAAPVLRSTSNACLQCKTGATLGKRSWKWAPMQSQCHSKVLSLPLSAQRATGITESHLIPTRHYSVYPPTYIKPIYEEEKLQELEKTGEKSKLAFSPIYPAHGDENASVFHDPAVSKFINYIMWEGQKEAARAIVEQTFATIKRIQLGKYYKTTDPKEREKIELNPWVVFHTAVNNAGPVLETMSIKRGGGTYQVPVPVRDRRKLFLAMKWLIEAGMDKEPTIPMYKKLAWEILDAANETGRVVKRKQDLHKVCEANRAYAHYRWG